MSSSRRWRDRDLESVTVISPRPQRGFVETPCIRELTDRALGYIRVGFPVHLCGPTGCGKTTLAMHIAYNLGRPMVLINGDEEYGPSSLIGGEFGYRRKKTIDRFVSRVYKSDESVKKTWIDERLTTACKYGFTLVYNEFTRSRPEANNVLLSVLEERMLEVPSSSHSESYIMVHPDFNAVFTSNPWEYAGVFRSQDALLDRLITLNLSYYDEQTEIQIAQAKSSLSYENAAKIVHLVRRLRESAICEHQPTLRASIVIARAASGIMAEGGSLRQACIDVLIPKIGRGKRGDLDPIAVIDELLEEKVAVA